MSRPVKPPFPVAWGVGIFLFVAAGVGAWLGLQSLETQQAEFGALQERLNQPGLASVVAEAGGPGRTSQETQKVRQLAQQMQEQTANLAGRWVRGTQEARGEGKEWSKDPGRWKDELILRQNELQKKAPDLRVQLPPDFYLGLEEFRQKSPTPEEVPDLAVQLSVASRLVERLLQARKIREQYFTVCELKSLAPSARGKEKPVPPGSKTPRANPERKTFQIEFQSSPEVLFEYIRLLASDDWLLILQDLSVTNEQPDFAPRSEIAKKFGGEAKSAEGKKGEEDSAGKLLEVLAGDEALNVRMEIAFVAWPESVPAPPTGPKPSSP